MSHRLTYLHVNVTRFFHVCLSQFAYGEDGMDGTFIEKTKFDLMTFSHAEFRMMYHIDLNAYAARGENWMNPSGTVSAAAWSQQMG